MYVLIVIRIKFIEIEKMISLLFYWYIDKLIEL